MDNSSMRCSEEEASLGWKTVDECDVQVLLSSLFCLVYRRPRRIRIMKWNVTGKKSVSRPQLVVQTACLFILEGIILTVSHYIILHLIALQYTTSHCRTLHHTVVHYITLQHTTSHFTTSHHITSNVTRSYNDVAAKKEKGKRKEKR